MKKSKCEETEIDAIILMGGYIIFTLWFLGFVMGYIISSLL